MLPPGQLTYYFTDNGKHKLDDETAQIEAQLAEKAVKLNLLNVPKTNIIENVIKTKMLITKTYLTNMKCIPRPERIVEQVEERLKTPWSIFNSVFKDYRPDN